jgi:hypothetical protein
MVEYSLRNPPCRLSIAPGNVFTDIFKIGDRSVRPDYFELHALAQDSTACQTKYPDHPI